VLSSPPNTRPCPRHHVDLPVRIVIPNGVSARPVSGRVTEISKSGMAVHSTCSKRRSLLIFLELLSPRDSHFRQSSSCSWEALRIGDLQRAALFSFVPPSWRISGSSPAFFDCQISLYRSSVRGAKDSLTTETSDRIIAAVFELLFLSQRSVQLTAGSSA
jgi:hypothetical protein